jgi:(p)ppGpp synthase/HD superfamily hydrolase
VSTTLTERYSDALTFAAEAHRSQVRKGTSVPYLSHLLAVSGLVLEHGGDEDQAIAGLLHDAIEDVGTHLRGPIRDRFGPDVLAIVEGCTDAEVIPKPPWQARKERYIAHLQTAPLPVLRVSAADKLHNARCILSDYRAIGPSLWQRFNATPTQIAWYYRSLADVFARCGAPPTLVGEMGATLAALSDVGAFSAEA